MANPTTHDAPPPAPQQRTPQMGQTPGSVGPMGAMPTGVVGGMRPSMTGVQQTPETAPADPVLFEDIDPVYLARLYPHAKSGEEQRALAMAAGAAAHDDGLALVAAQQQAVAELPPLPPPAPPPEPSRQHPEQHHDDKHK